MNFMVVFDVVIAVLGIYLIYSAIQMKKTGEISNVIVNPEEIAKCKNKRGFIDFIYDKVMLFGVVSLVFGILGGINDGVYSFGKIFTVISVSVFVLAWFWFSNQLRKGRDKFFY